jgi:hypothetical protein
VVVARDYIPLGDDTPFAPYLPYVNGPDDPDAAEREAADKARHEADQAFMVECMKEAGFVYYEEPWTEPSVNRFFENGDVLWLPALQATRDETARAGYGLMEAIDLPGLAATEVMVRNSQYRDTLSEAARTEYDLQVDGPDPYDPSPPAHEPGCAELLAAKREVETSLATEQEASLSDVFDQQFGELVGGMETLVMTGLRYDSNVAGLNSQWASCMANRGYDLTSGGYPQEGLTPWVAWDMALRTRADGTLGDAWYNYQGEEFTPEEERSLLGTTAEIQIALDDFDCRQEAGD